MRRILIVLGLVAALTVPAWAIIGKENIVRNGTAMLLPLAPRDPRSLMQGDFMRLDYAMARTIAKQVVGHVGDGIAIVRIDKNSVATLVRIDAEGALKGHEHRLAFRKRGRSVRLSSHAFFFEEGTAKRYATARFGAFRVSEAGVAVLIALHDEDRVRL
jgi:uncharacterized membrane-anchored protein